jgi:hypothetical protein
VDVRLLIRLLLAFVLSASLAEAQTLTITGTVSDSMTSAPFSIGASQAQTAITIVGLSTIGTALDSGNGNRLAATKVSISQSAVIQSLSFYAATASGQLILGLYDSTGPNGQPGNLLATTSVFTPVNGWNTVNVVTPVLLNVGTYYLAHLPSTSALIVAKDPGSGVSYNYSVAFGALPTAFATTGLSSTGDEWSFYATLTTGSSGTFSISIGVNPSGAGAVTIECIARC